MIFSNNTFSPRQIRTQNNFESNVLCSLKFKQLLPLIQAALQPCPICLVRKRNHYCLQANCPKKQLICAQCETQSIQQPHYLHNNTYILPLISKDIFHNFYKLKERFQAFHQDIQEEIHKIQDYLRELGRISDISLKQIQSLQQEQKVGRIKEYIPKMQEFLSNYKTGDKLSSVLEGFKFISAQQCSLKQQNFKNQMQNSLNNLKWPKDPQKILKDKLKTTQQQPKKQLFISSNKILQINQIDHNFRNNQEFLTQNLQHHPVRIALEPDLLSKNKYYESFIHHFKNCKKLAIQNGSFLQLKTPISFQELQQLEFVFNIEPEFQHLRLQSINQNLKELTLKKVRQQDLKLLKQVTGACYGLKKFHLELSNKVDVYSNRDLIQILRGMSKGHLSSFTLKIRTESQVKRLYGYLSKYYKDQSQILDTLNNSILQILQANRGLTKVVIQGVKPLEMGAVYIILRELPFLMDYKIYFENIDLMTEITEKEVKELEKICYKRKRVFFSLAKASKEKFLSKRALDNIVSDFLI